MTNKLCVIGFLGFLFFASPVFSSPEKNPDDPVIVFETNQGNFQARLFSKDAPKAIENMLGLAAKNYYDGLIFHRVIDGFMIQSGDPTGTGYAGQSLWGKPFEDETRSDVSFDKKGILAMANSGPNTNASQFFITLVPTPHLNGRHTIFGEIISGMDVVEKISKTKVNAKDKPVDDQKILKVYLLPKSSSTRVISSSPK